MGASESIYGARGVESGAAEPEGQLMHRTPLSPALMWSSRAGPTLAILDPWDLKRRSCEQDCGRRGAYLQELGVLSAAAIAA